MNIDEFQKTGAVLQRSRKLLCSVVGFMYVGYSNANITVYVKPGNLVEARRSLPSEVEGIPIKVEGRSDFPSF